MCKGEHAMRAFSSGYPFTDLAGGAMDLLHRILEEARAISIGSEYTA
jgi:hypothetical protein